MSSLLARTHLPFLPEPSTLLPPSVASSHLPSLPSFVPPDLPNGQGGVLPYWMLFVSTLACFNTVQNYISPTLTRKVYAGKPDQGESSTIYFVSPSSLPFSFAQLRPHRFRFWIWNSNSLEQQDLWDLDSSKCVDQAVCGLQHH